MVDLKRTPVYKKHIRKPPSHVKGFCVAFLVMLATIYTIVYFADVIDKF